MCRASPWDLQGARAPLLRDKYEMTSCQGTQPLMSSALIVWPVCEKAHVSDRGSDSSYVS